MSVSSESRLMHSLRAAIVTGIVLARFSYCTSDRALLEPAALDSMREFSIYEVPEARPESVYRLQVNVDQVHKIHKFPNLQSLHVFGSATQFPGDALRPHLLQSLALNLDARASVEIPEEIGDLRYLTSLRLHGMNLNSLPANVRNLQLLERLDLSRNKFTEIPPQTFTLPGLRELSLSGNNIQILPTRWEKLIGLRLLDLSKNPLSRIPRELLLQLTELDRLVLNDTRCIQMTVDQPSVAAVSRNARPKRSNRSLNRGESVYLVGLESPQWAREPQALVSLRDGALYYVEAGSLAP